MGLPRVTVTDELQVQDLSENLFVRASNNRIKQKLTHEFVSISTYHAVKHILLINIMHISSTSCGTNQHKWGSFCSWVCLKITITTQAMAAYWVHGKSLFQCIIVLFFYTQLLVGLKTASEVTSDDPGIYHVYRTIIYRVIISQLTYILEKLQCMLGSYMFSTTIMLIVKCALTLTKGVSSECNNPTLRHSNLLISESSASLMNTSEGIVL